MLGPVREFARTLLSFVLTRTRLAATEIEEQALRLIEILVWLAVALFFLGIAIVFAALLVVLLFWDSNRLLAPTDALSAMATSVFQAVRRIFREARKYPLLALAGGVVLAAMRPRRAIGWIARGWSLYRLYRSLAPVVQRFAASAGAPVDRPRHPS